MIILTHTPLLSYIKEGNGKVLLKPSFSFICKNYSNARYVMFDELFALVELSFIDANTLLWGQEQL